ncbi:hypothetical protein D9M71_754810 [compost metagenome]
MTTAGDDQQAEHHRDGTCGEQPPGDGQHCCQKVARHILDPGGRLQGADTGTDQHPAEQQEHAQAQADPPVSPVNGDHLPEQEIERYQADADQ